MRDTRQYGYRLDPDGSYRIDGYDRSPAFASFLPGLAGPDGVPLWCMYVNRAQAIVSFGVQDKDHAIAEFLPATWAYQLVGIQGFRTFCWIDGSYYEPFRVDTGEGAAGCTRAMRIRPDHLELQEENPAHGLRFRVEYFSPVNRPLGALSRRLTVSNTSTVSKQVRILDGLPLIIPAGFTDSGLKTMRHINEAYAAVRLAAGVVPYYSAKVVAHDEAEITRVPQGNFYAAWLAHDDELVPIEPYVDPHVVFGSGNDLITPRLFGKDDWPARAAQIWENRLPCALVPLSATLEPGASVTLVALAGSAPSEPVLANFLARFRQPRDVDAAADESRQLLETVLEPVRTVSSLPVLDAYTQWNYLDNILRGGVPRLLPSKAGPTLLHLYARRHGDLERDYNYFILPPHPLSSGAGNYRDVCQNRRWDVWFNPEVAEHEIRMFVELLQADGYNPLAVDGYRWILDKHTDPFEFCPTTNAAARREFEAILEGGFRPGELLQWADVHSLTIDDRSAWLAEVLARCDRELVAHGHAGGYWIDHWTYVIDLLEAFAAVYPDRVAQMLVGAPDAGWFDEGAYVAARRDKYVIRTGGPLQLDAVIDGEPAANPLPPVTVFGKLCALLAVKAVTFDYHCRGLEMEAGRPGWNDALNGLPGLFGSSTCEAAELARLAAWLRKQLPAPPDTELPVEVADLLDEVIADLALPSYSWDRAATIREKYRRRIRSRVGGRSRTVEGLQLQALLAGVEARARAALASSVDPKTGLVHTYFINNPVGLSSQDYEASEGGSSLADRVKGFTPRPLPLFLEGQVHWLRLQDTPEQARAIHHAVRQSPLLDTALQMYRLNECLDACPPEIGRARVFTRGWFENESIWLHMSYKYLLELLRAGLHAEFFADAGRMLVPFMDPMTYGRSVLENSSFIASSANPDPRTRGRGFIARLSGSTAEFIHMWLLLTVGRDPFLMERGLLRFRVRPALPGEWFTRQATTIRWRNGEVEIPENCFACALLGATLLVYHNDARRDTFGPAAVRPARYVLDDGDPIDATSVGEPVARRIRERAYRRLDVWLQSVGG